MTAGSPPRPVACRFPSITLAAPPSFSTNVAVAAPRDSASIPAAPLPAKRSSTRAPSRSGSRIAKSVCFTRSASGRVPGPGARSRIPLALPAMTRPASAIRSGPALGIADPAPFEPAVRQLAEERRGVRPEPAGPVQERLGVLARAAGQRDVLAILERRDAQPGQAGLGQAEDVALAA